MLPKQGSSRGKDGGSKEFTLISGNISERRRGEKKRERGDAIKTEGAKAERESAPMTKRQGQTRRNRENKHKVGRTRRQFCFLESIKSIEALESSEVE